MSLFENDSSSSSDEEDQVREINADSDMALTTRMLQKLQQLGENVLVDDLISVEKEEWDVDRILDVLISLQLVQIEKHRGIENRTSRAFSYRTGYAGMETKLDSLKEDIAVQEGKLDASVSRCKRLRLEINKMSSDSPSSKAHVQEFLRSFLESSSFLQDESIARFLLRD